MNKSWLNKIKQILYMQQYHKIIEKIHVFYGSKDNFNKENKDLLDILKFINL